MTTERLRELATILRKEIRQGSVYDNPFSDAEMLEMAVALEDYANLLETDE